MISMDAAAPASARATVALSVLVVDDQLAVREGLSRLLACASIPLWPIRTAATGAEALSAMRLHRPELVVLDADLGGEDGLALIPQLSQTARVLVLTSHGDAGTRARATALGARAFVEKHEPAAVLLGMLAEIGGHPQSRGEKPPAPQGTSSLPAMARTSDAAGGPQP